MRRIWTGSSRLDAPRMRTGKLARSNLRSLGRSASSGRRGITRSSRSRTSLAAVSKSVPHVNVTRTLLLPSDEAELTSSTPGTALIASSMRRVTSSSISSGLALL